MPTSTFNIAASADDQNVAKDSSSVWPPNTSTAVDQFATFGLYPGREFFNAVYRNYNSLLRWDTSALPDDVTVTSAILRMYCIEKNPTDGYNLIGDYYAWDGSVNDYALDPTPTAFSVALTSLTLSADNDFALNNLSNINLTGYTSLRVSVSGTGTPTGRNEAGFAAFEDATFTEARLIVTYQALTRIQPDAILSQTNLTGAITAIQDDPDSPDANWLLAP